jgi:hypothetical protein
VLDSRTRTTRELARANSAGSLRLGFARSSTLSRSNERTLCYSAASRLAGGILLADAGRQLVGMAVVRRAEWHRKGSRELLKAGD